MENPSGQIIEKLEFTQSEELPEDKQEGSGVQPTIVRPSSLNYKISLLEATQSFIQKDKQADQVLDVELEEPTSKKMQNYDILDDALFLINKPPKIGIKPKVQTKGSIEQAQWEREEDLIRKKLERSSINMMKNKIAQQNRVAQEQSTAQAETDAQGQAGQG